MVGIVIVSHSIQLAEGIIELSMQMAQGDVKVLNAAGTGDNEIGTDATKIMEAISKADDGSGVVVLCDLGSAIMSTQTALDFLGDEIKDKVIIADCPIVEGCIGAVVQASIGGTVEEVKAAAEESREMSKLD